MKQMIVLLFALFIIVSGCKKNSKSTSVTASTTYSYTGTITGPDLGMTSCSGGYFITISGISGTLRFNTLPSGSGIDLTTATIPVNVKLNWHFASDPHPCGIIIIDAITRAD